VFDRIWANMGKMIGSEALQVYANVRVQAKQARLKCMVM
jgi:hypothetical protein